MSVYLMKVGVDENGGWLRPIQERIYTLKHKYWKQRLTHEEDEQKREIILAEEVVDSLTARASITAGCHAVLQLSLIEELPEYITEK